MVTTFSARRTRQQLLAPLFLSKSISLSITLALSTTAAHAAESTQDESNHWETIEVYAQRSPQQKLKVPVSLELIKGETIAAMGSLSLEETMQILPGVFAGPNSSASKLFIRGIGSQGNAGMDQTVAVFVDNVYYSRSRAIKGSLFDIEQLEVLKGPQPLHYGMNTTAGLFSVHTREASLNNESGYGSINWGDNQTLGLEFAQDIQISEKLALRPAVRIQNSDGYWDMVDSLNGQVTSDSATEEHFLRLNGLYQANEQLSFHLKLESQQQDRDNPYAWQPGGCSNLYGLGFSNQQELNQFWQSTGSTEPNPLKVPFTCRQSFSDNQFDQDSPASPFNRSSLQQDNLTLQTTWQKDKLNIELITAWLDNEFSFSGNDLSHGSNFQRIFWSQDNIKQISQEVRINREIGEQLTWLSGFYWHRNEVIYGTNDVDARRQNREQVSLSDASQTEKQLSIYSSLNWQLSEHWSLQPGLRWNQTEKNFDGLDFLYNGQLQTPETQDAFLTQLKADVSAHPDNYSNYRRRLRSEFREQSLSFNALMPSISLMWQAHTDTMLYYKWQKGVKSGGFNFRLNNLSEDALVYDQEQVYAHELGVRSLLFNKSLTLEASVFFSDYRDLQQNSNFGEDGIIGGSRIRNVAQASSDGLELDISWHVNDALSLQAQATWLNAKFDNYRGADCTRLQSVVSASDVASLFGAQRTQQNNSNGQGGSGGQGNSGGQGGSGGQGSSGGACFQDLSGAALPLAPEFTSLIGLNYEFSVGHGMQVAARVDWIYSDGFFTSPHADSLRRQGNFNKINGNITLSKDNWQLSLNINNLTNKMTSSQLGQDGNAAVSALLDPPRYWLLRGSYLF